MFSRLSTPLLLILLCLPFSVAASANTRGLSLKLTDSKGGKQSVDLYQGSHALLIGASDYTAGWPDLESIPEELERIAKKLTERGFNVVKVSNPSSRELSRAMEDFIDLYGFDENNRLLFFYSGHGYSRDNGSKGYLVPTDAPDPRKDEKGFLRKAINMSQILSWARQIEAKHAMFLFDSCFSGTVFKSRALPAFPPHINEATAKPVRQFISAGSAGEEVPARSVFVPALLRALDGDGDINSDGYMTGTELGMYLHNAVLNYQTFQTPQYGKIRDPELDEGDFVFINPNFAIPVEEAPADAIAEKTSAEEQQRREADAFWAEIKDAVNPTMFKLFSERYPEHSMAALAKIKAEELKKLAEEKRKKEQQQQENLFWESIKDSHSAEALNAYLNEFPEGRFTKIAQLKLEQLANVRISEKQKTERQELAKKREQEEQAREEETVFWNSIRKSNSTNLYQAYLDKYPQGRFVDLAQAMKADAQKLQQKPGQAINDKPKIKIALLPVMTTAEHSDLISKTLTQGVAGFLKNKLKRYEVVATARNLISKRIPPNAYQFSDTEKKQLWKKDGFFSRSTLDVAKAVEICKETGSDIAIAYRPTVIRTVKRRPEINMEIILIDPNTKEFAKRDITFSWWVESWKEIAKLTDTAVDSFNKY